MTDNINKPSHYQGRYGMESIDALRNFMTPEQLKVFRFWKREIRLRTIRVWKIRCHQVLGEQIPWIFQMMICRFKEG